MKKILFLISTVIYLMLPLQSFAVITSIPDNELEGISAQIGSVTVRVGHVLVQSANLKNISTDGWNYWDSDHDLTNSLKNPHPNNAPGYFDGTTETNPQKYPGVGKYNDEGYIGYDQSRLTGGMVIHSGSMTMEVVSTNDPNVSSGLKLDVVMNHSGMDAPISVESVIKLADNPDLVGDQSLGRIYTSGISQSQHGRLSVYAHNNTPNVGGFH